MGLYYIYEVLDNQRYIIANHLGSVMRDVTLKELSDLKDIVIGYNRVTNTVSKKERGDMEAYIQSKLKLMGNSVDSVRLVNRDYIIEKGIYTKEGNIIKILVTDRDIRWFGADYFYYLSIRWDYILSSTNLGEVEKDTIIDISLDIDCYENVDAISPFRINQNIAEIRINIINKDMFVKCCNGNPEYYCRDVIDLFNFKIDIPVVVDFNNVKFDFRTKTKGIFYNTKVINLPEKFYSMEHTLVYEALDVSHNDLKGIIEKYKRATIGVKELRYSNIESNKYLQMNIHKIIRADQLYFDKPVTLDDLSNSVISLVEKVHKQRLKVGALVLSPDFKIDIDANLKQEMLNLLKAFTFVRLGDEENEMYIDSFGRSYSGLAYYIYNMNKVIDNRDINAFTNTQIRALERWLHVTEANPEWVNILKTLKEKLAWFCFSTSVREVIYQDENQITDIRLLSFLIEQDVKLINISKESEYE